MQHNDMTAEDYCNRGYTYKSQGKLDLAIADYTQAIELNPNYALAKRNLKSLLSGEEKPELFKFLKKLFAIKQIPLLEQCLDKNTVLGERFWEKEGKDECNTESGTLKEIKEHLTSLKLSIDVWILQGPQLVIEGVFSAEIFIHITSFIAGLSNNDTIIFYTSERCYKSEMLFINSKEKISNNFKLGLFSISEYNAELDQANERYEKRLMF